MAGVSGDSEQWYSTVDGGLIVSADVITLIFEAFDSPLKGTLSVRFSALRSVVLYPNGADSGSIEFELAVTDIGSGKVSERTLTVRVSAEDGLAEARIYVPELHQRAAGLNAVPSPDLDSALLESGTAPDPHLDEVEVQAQRRTGHHQFGGGSPTIGDARANDDPDASAIDTDASPPEVDSGCGRNGRNRSHRSHGPVHPDNGRQRGDGRTSHNNHVFDLASLLVDLVSSNVPAHGTCSNSFALVDAQYDSRRTVDRRTVRLDAHQPWRRLLVSSAGGINCKDDVPNNRQLARPSQRHPGRIRDRTTNRRIHTDRGQRLRRSRRPRLLLRVQRLRPFLTRVHPRFRSERRQRISRTRLFYVRPGLWAGVDDLVGCRIAAKNVVVDDADETLDVLDDRRRDVRAAVDSGVGALVPPGEVTEAGERRVAPHHVPRRQVRSRLGLVVRSVVGDHQCRQLLDGDTVEEPARRDRQIRRERVPAAEPLHTHTDTRAYSAFAASASRSAHR